MWQYFVAFTASFLFGKTAYYLGEALWVTARAFHEAGRDGRRLAVQRGIRSLRRFLSGR